jgi:AbrB family looped-hinge helix DNA binding protein
MNRLATTRLSSKGQIVIPEEIREQMQLQTGDKFLILAEDDVVVLKAISRSDNEYHYLLKKARNAAKKTGLTKAEVATAIKKARKK